MTLQEIKILKDALAYWIDEEENPDKHIETITGSVEDGVLTANTIGIKSQGRSFIITMQDWK